MTGRTAGDFMDEQVRQRDEDESRMQDEGGS